MAQGLAPQKDHGMRLVGNAELEERRREREEREQADQQPVMNRLAAYLQKQWQAAYEAKTSNANGERSVEDQILEDYKQRDGQYTDAKIAEIRQVGGSEIYMELTGTKCRAADAWLEDILLGSGDQPWGLEPSPIQDLPPDVEQQIRQTVGQNAMAYLQQQGQMPDPQEVQQAMEDLREEVKRREEEATEKAAEGMEEKLADQFHEGGFTTALRDAIPDITTTKAGIVKGPILRKRNRLAWVKGPDGKTTVDVEEEIRPEYERVSPLNIYPLPDTTDFDEGAFFERSHFAPQELRAVMDMPGYDREAIEGLLRDHPEGTQTNHLEVDRERREHEQKDSRWTQGGPDFEVKIYWGSASGRDLASWGMDIEDEAEWYEINAWLCAGKVIKAALNPDPLGRRPYHKASYEQIPGAFWGRGIAELIRDLQNVCNATARAMVNNMGIASGPQVYVNDTERIPADQDLTQIYPWKIWQFEPDSEAVTSHRPPLEFYQPSPITQNLMGVYDYFSRLADDQSGIPAYTYGNSKQTGAGNTASGLSMLMDHASKSLKRVITAIDHGIIRRLVQRQYEHNMLFVDDESIKGDLQVKARGPAALVEKQQRQATIQEALQLTNNPVDMQIIGLKGRAHLLREQLRSMDVPGVEDWFPSDDEIEQREKQQAQQPDPDMVEAQVDQFEAQTDRAQAESEIALNEAKAERERTQSLLDQVKAWAEANGLDPDAIDQEIQADDAPQTQGSAGGAGAGGPSGQPGMGQGPGVAGGGTGANQRGQRSGGGRRPAPAGAGGGQGAPVPGPPSG